MQVHGARTDILLVHRRVESGFSGDRGSMLENHWKCRISFGKSLESLAGKQNTGKFVESLVYIRIVNHRPDDECQRACGVYRSVDEGQQVQVIKTQVTGIW